MNTKYGGSAFPSFAPEINGAFFPGMTLRDFFAGQALEKAASGKDKTAQDIAARAYYIADAMLAAREAKQ